jgi:hypothetical protein
MKRRIILCLIGVLLGVLPGRPVPHRAAAARLAQGRIPLELGMAVSGTLDDQTFREIYTFTGQANQVVAIHMSRTSGDLDPYLLLADAQGSVLAVSDDEGSGADALIGFERIPADGQYFVIATRFGQEHGSTGGDYELLIEQVGAGVNENTVLAYGNNVIGRISPDEPIVFYFIRAQRGDVITVTLKRTSGDLDPLLELATSDGKVLSSNDDDPAAEGTLDAGILNYMVLETNVYLIVATRFGREAGDTTGSYVLSLAQIPVDELGQNPEQARLMDYGSTFEGEVSDDLPVRYYRFEARRGDVITAALIRESGELDPMIKLVDASLVVLTQDDDTGDGSDARIAAYTLPTTGTYYLLATRSEKQKGDTTGTFTIELTGRAGIAGGRTLEIVYGATVTGSLDSQNVAEEYIFLGQQGDTIRITMKRASGDLDSLVTLFDSEHKQIAFDDDSAGGQDALIDEFTLPRDGSYTLVASRFDREKGTTNGAYILTLELVRAGR